MTPTSQFEILRRQRILNASGKFLSASGTLPAAGTVTAERGIALGAVGASPVSGATANDSEAFDFAQHNTYIGNLTRRVVVGGLDLASRVFGVTSAVPVGLESPFQDGLEVTVERPEEMELEGSTYLVVSGTGAITTSTAIGANLSYYNGLLRASQTNEIVNFQLTANNLTSTDGTSLRIRVITSAN